MKRKNWWKYLCMIAMSLLLTGCSLNFESLFFAQKEVPEYSFSGYVYADGLALEGATVDCGTASTKTNEKGYFKFSNVSSVVQVSASKDGYVFLDNLVYVSGIASNVNFSGYKLFDKSGVVKNNNITIAEVDILAESDNGTFVTKSNEYGEFYLPSLAGKVKVTASKDGFNFFTQSFTIDKEDSLVISGIANISGKIEADREDIVASEFSLTVGGASVEINDDLTFVLNDVEPGVTLSLTSTNFHIENATRILGSDLEDVVFVAQKYYNILGTVKCGNQIVNDATIKLGDKKVVATDGHFELNNLYGENKLECVLDGFKFEDINVLNDNDVIFDGTTAVSGKVVLDIGNSENFNEIELKLNGQIVTLDNMGRFTIQNARFGETMSVSSQTYFVPNSLKIQGSSQIIINCQKYFNLNVSVMANNESLDGVEINVINSNSLSVFGTVVDGQLVINNLYGDCQVLLSKDNYKFEDLYECDYFQNSLHVSAQKIYSVSGKVISGDLVLTDAKVLFGNETINVRKDGSFILENIYGNPEITILCENYNCQKIVLDINNLSINVNMSYDVHGVVSCGDSAVKDVVVVANNISERTDENGHFELKDLYGTCEISYSKNWYTFPKNIVTCAQINENCLKVSSLYSLQGNVSKKSDNSDGKENLANFKILITNKTTGEILTTHTDSQGNYKFNNLVGEYVLLYDMDSALALKPKHYDVTVGGVYDFSNNGYSFGGTIVCGDTPLSGVSVSVGSLQTTTNEQGKYNFGLVTQPGILTIEKDGYSFTPVGHDGRVNDDNDGMEDVNYVATYKVEGVVKSGNVSLAGCLVTIGNKSTTTDSYGKFQIDGLVGKNNVISLSLEKYTFYGIKEVSGYMTLNYSATFDINAYVKTSDICISGATLYVNNINQNIQTNEQGFVKITNVKLGDKISFIKDNYKIENITLNSYAEICNLNSTYSVCGYVTNCGSPLYRVIVSVDGGDRSVETNEKGYFELSQLQGTNTLSFEKTGFDFDNVQVTGYESLAVMSKFDVSGIVKVGGVTPLEGVLVSAGNLTATTDKNGKFKIEGISTITTFKFQKEGFDFGEDVEVSTPDLLNISATFKVVGCVQSGDIKLSGATITIEDGSGRSYISDDDGNFEIIGLTQPIGLKVIKEGYNPKTIENISTYEPQLNVNLDYNLDIVFSGLDSADEYSAIVITINNVRTEICNTSNYTLIQLTGETLIKLEKDSWKFEPTNDNNEFVVSKFETKNISITKMFDISGYIKTNSGLAIKGVTVYAGSKSATTDKYGYYSITNLSGSPKLKAVLPYYNPTSEQEEVGVVVNNSGEYNLSFADDKFVLNFLNFGYDNLRNAKSYQIFGNGNVSAAGQNQIVALIYKQDAKGNKIFENKNKGSEIMGIDPNVALLSCFYTEDGVRKVKYQQIFGTNNLKDDYANYSEKWDATTDVETYLNEYGVNADGFSPYVINANTIQNISGLALKDGVFSFKITLNPSKEEQANYVKLMGKMCSSQTFKSFKNINLTFTITQDGYLRTMAIDESYVVNKVIDVTVTAGINYKFLINSLTEEIGEITTTTPLTVLESLKKGEEQAKESTKQGEILMVEAINIDVKNNAQKVDLIIYKKEQLV